MQTEQVAGRASSWFTLRASGSYLVVCPKMDVKPVQLAPRPSASSERRVRRPPTSLGMSSDGRARRWKFGSVFVGPVGFRDSAHPRERKNAGLDLAVRETHCMKGAIYAKATSLTRPHAAPMPAKRLLLSSIWTLRPSCSARSSHSPLHVRSTMTVALGPAQDVTLEADHLPPGTSVLLHSCCAPCSGAMIEQMLHERLNVTVRSLYTKSAPLFCAYAT